jgi:hypothetical protein
MSSWDDSRREAAEMANAAEVARSAKKQREIAVYDEVLGAANELIHEIDNNVQSFIRAMAATGKRKRRLFRQKRRVMGMDLARSKYYWTKSGSDTLNISLGDFFLTIPASEGWSLGDSSGNILSSGELNIEKCYAEDHYQYDEDRSDHLGRYRRILSRSADFRRMARLLVAQAFNENGL